VAITAPVPRPTHRVSHDGPTARWHSRATLGLLPVLSRSLGIEAGSRRSFRPPHPPMVSPTAVHFELGPRSLDPAAVFAARLPSLFETRRRLTTSATAIRGTSNQTRPLVFSLGRWPRPPSGSYTPRPLPCGIGDVRRAALRSLRRPRCWFFPLAQTYPTAMPSRAPRHRSVLPNRCIARINVHGSKDRAKDASRGACTLVPASGAYA